MNTMHAGLLALTAGATVAVSGCEYAVAGAGDATFLVATFNGAVNMEYRGSGRFHSGPDPRRPAAPVPFFISSTGDGAQANQVIQFYRGAAAIPAPGVYPVNAATDGEVAGFRVTYQTLDQQGATLDLYSAQDGHVEIIESGEDRIAGSFRFTAFRSCARVVSGSTFSCTPLATSVADTPRVAVTGSFVATRTSGLGRGFSAP